MIKQAFLAFLLLITIPVIAQEPTTDTPVRTDDGPVKKEYYWFNPHAAVNIPNPMSNKAFRKHMAGVYEVSAGMDILLFRGFFAGAVYEHTTFKITGITGATYFHYQPLMKVNNAGLRVGARSYIGSRNRMIGVASVTVGESWAHFKDIRCKDSTVAVPLTRYTSPYVQPEIGVFFLVESNFAIGATISYTACTKKFDPYEICLDSWKAIGDVGSGSTQYLSFGFGFYYSFLKKKDRP